jgi:hypothetical protein
MESGLNSESFVRRGFSKRGKPRVALSSSRNAVRNFIRAHNEALTVAMRVGNPDCSPFTIYRCDVAQTPTAFLEIVYCCRAFRATMSLI